MFVFKFPVFHCSPAQTPASTEKRVTLQFWNLDGKNRQVGSILRLTPHKIHKPNVFLVHAQWPNAEGSHVRKGRRGSSLVSQLEIKKVRITSEERNFGTYMGAYSEFLFCIKIWNRIILLVHG
jgi:hypothetical protein